MLCKIIRPPVSNGLFFASFLMPYRNFIPTKLYIIGKEILSSICYLGIDGTGLWVAYLTISASPSTNPASSHLPEKVEI